MKVETLSICAPDLAERLGQWNDHLQYEKNLSRHTLRAYSTDLSHFVTFLLSHLGHPPGLNDLSEVSLRDFRAWLSRKAMDGAGSASRARSLSGVKNFLSWLDRQGIMHNATIKTVRTPKLPHKLPKPLQQKQTFEVLDQAGLLATKDWVAARDRALFTLLYGCGLRIDEALSLNIGDWPEDQSLTVTGKGNKQRQVPLLPIVQAAMENYLALSPHHTSSLREGRKADAAISEIALLRLAMTLLFL